MNKWFHLVLTRNGDKLQAFADGKSLGVLLDLHLRGSVTPVSHLDSFLLSVCSLAVPVDDLSVVQMQRVLNKKTVNRPWETGELTEFACAHVPAIFCPRRCERWLEGKTWTKLLVMCTTCFVLQGTSVSVRA